MTEMTEMLMYLAENGYPMGSFEAFEETHTVEETREILVAFLGEDPRS